MLLLSRATGRILYSTNNCYCTLMRNFAKIKWHRRHFSKVSYRNERWCGARFMSSAPVQLKEENSSYVAYENMLAQRRNEAQRSVVIQVLSYASCPDVWTYCSQFGNIDKIFHYNLMSNGDQKNFVLIEYEKKEYANAIKSSSTHLSYDQVIPAHTSLLWFRNVPNNKKLDNHDAAKIKIKHNSCKISDDAELTKNFLSSKSVCDQIMILYNSTKLNDVGTRLRFFTSYQIEHCFSSLFPNIAVFPFGSSVNGFGKQDCDLDLCLVLDHMSKVKLDSRLVFQTKSMSSLEKQQVKKLMDIFAETINMILPGVSNVRKILEARVPIIKFDHVLCGTQCDLTLSNFTAYYMSELLYIFGELDYRVRPLVFVIRKWAENLHLVNKVSPGPWLTNFSLTLMIIFFLQQKNVLPSLNTLKSKATESDVRIADGYVDCTFLRNLKNMPQSTNDETLESLLLNFFIYYSDFEFDTKALSLKTGEPLVKPEHVPLYICNPLETNLNVSKNVSTEQLNRITMCMRNAAYNMEYYTNKNNDSWGIINLLMLNSADKERAKKRGLVDFKDLFETEQEMMHT